MQTQTSLEQPRMKHSCTNTHINTHTAWKRRKVRIRSSLCLSLRASWPTQSSWCSWAGNTGGHAHDWTHTHTHTMHRHPLCIFFFFLASLHVNSVRAVGHLSLCVKVPCLSPRLPLRDGKGSRPMHAAQCSCCWRTIVKVIKDELLFCIHIQSWSHSPNVFLNVFFVFPNVKHRQSFLDLTMFYYCPNKITNVLCLNLTKVTWALCITTGPTGRKPLWGRPYHRVF